jgi:hypothetical protein
LYKNISPSKEVDNVWRFAKAKKGIKSKESRKKIKNKDGAVVKSET